MEIIRNEFLLLKALVIFTESKTVVEVGVQRGDMAVHLCAAAEVNNGIYIGFDVWDIHGLNKQFEKVGDKTSVTNRLIENKLSKFVLENIDTVKNRKLFEERLDVLCLNGIDFAFIDACHSYQGISNDFKSIYSRLSTTGTIAFHDTLRIDGCREFMLDLRTKFNDGTFDLIDFPFGSGDRRCGVSILSKRSFPILDVGIDEICGSISEPSVIEYAETEWYKSETRKRSRVVNQEYNVDVTKFGLNGTRKKFS